MIEGHNTLLENSLSLPRKRKKNENISLTYDINKHAANSKSTSMSTSKFV